MSDENLRNYFKQFNSKRGPLDDYHFEFIEKDFEIKKVFLGFEPSGTLHLGHFMLFLLIEKILSLKEELEVTILLADLHLKLANKTNSNIEDYKKRIETFFKKYSNNYKIIYDSALKEDLKYRAKFDELISKINLNQVIRSTCHKSRMDPYLSTFSNLVYPVYQALDAPFIEQDLVLGAKDQRKVHMFMLDHIHKVGLKAPNVVHIPLILTQNYNKMSSSGDHCSLNSCYNLIKQNKLEVKELCSKYPNLESIFKEITNCTDEQFEDLFLNKIKQFFE